MVKDTTVKDKQKTKEEREGWAGCGEFLSHTDVSRKMTVNEMVKELGNAGFQAKKVAEATDVWEQMIKDKDCTKFLALSGSLVPGGMRNVIAEMLKNRFVDVVVSNGSNITHDLIEAFGERHRFLDSEVTGKITDVELQQKGLNRIYNIVLPNRGYVALEDNLKELLPQLPQKEMGSREFLSELGKLIKDKSSILKIATEQKIPVFIPAFSDCVLAFHVWMYSQEHKLTVNTTLDQTEMLDITFNSKRAGAIITQGGVPKHYVAMAMQVSPQALNYAIQITLVRPEDGSVSGAKLEEAKSWKKVAADAKTVDLVCDPTIALPLIVSALKERLK